MSMSMGHADRGRPTPQFSRTRYALCVVFEEGLCNLLLKVAIETRNYEAHLTSATAREDPEIRAFLMVCTELPP